MQEERLMPKVKQIRLTGTDRELIVDKAIVQYAAGNDDIEVDSVAEVVDNEAEGYWVQAWVFVRYDSEEGEDGKAKT